MRTHQLIAMLTKIPIKLFKYSQFTKQIITFLKLSLYYIEKAFSYTSLELSTGRTTLATLLNN